MNETEKLCPILAEEDEIFNTNNLFNYLADIDIINHI